MGKLIDKATGQPVFVPSGTEAEALRSGRYELPAEAVLQEVGTSQTVVADQAEAARLLGTGESRFQTGEEVYDTARDAELEAQYGTGLANNAKALLAGGARGLTLGLSDLVLDGTLDDESRFGLEQLRLRNEIASTAGEIGGALAPALFTGGTGLLGSAARLTPAGAITRAGASAASRIAGESVAVKALQGAVQAGFEGAGMGFGNSITQAALHDDPFTVESVAANMALGSVLGGVTGGVFGAANAGISRALGKAKPLSATTPVDEMTAGLRTVQGKAKDIVAEYRAVSPGLEGLPSSLQDEVRRAGSVAGRHGALVKNAKNAGTNLNSPEYRAAEREVFAANAGRGDFPAMRSSLFGGKSTPPPPRATGAVVADDAIVQQFRAAEKGLKQELGDTFDLAKVFTANGARSRTVAEYFEKYTSALSAMDDKLGQRFGVKLDLGDDALRAKLADAGLDVGKATTGELAESVGMGGASKQALAFKDWLDKASSPTRLLLEARRMVLESAPEAAAAKASGFKKFVGALGVGGGRNLIPGGLRGSGWASSTLRGGVRQVGGMLGGKVARLAAGGTAGYAVDGKRGAIEGAFMASRASGHTASRVATGAARAVKALTGRTAAKAVTAGSILGATSFGNEKDKNPARARMKEIAAAVTNPATNNALRTATLPLYLQNPAVGEKVQTALAGRLQYLAERSPWRPPRKAMRTFKAEPQPSHYEVAKWARVVRAAEQPLTLLEDLQNGQITPEAVTTVKDLYPELFGRMQVAVMEQVAYLKQGLPYQSRQQIAVFFDTPIDASQTPEFGATIAGLYGGQNTPQPVSAGGSMPASTPKSVAGAGTQTQRLSMPV